MVNYYDLLKISPGASKEEIRRAFYKLAKQYHPDVSKNSRAFLKILNAYKTLIDKEKKQEYDRKLKINLKTDGIMLPPGRVNYAVSLSDIARMRFFNPARRRSGILPNLKGYDVSVDITPEELASGAVVKIDVPAHVICPLCRGDHIHCRLCSDRGYVLRAVGIPVSIPEGISHDDVFTVPLRKIKYKDFAFAMVKELSVRVKIIKGEENERSKGRSY
ncbi:MAG: DnaJ domain-containing protein [Spirochaetota bacterium]